MVNREKVEGILRNLERYTGHLRALGTLSRDEFLADPIKVGGARYYGERGVNLAAGICAGSI